MQFGAKPLFENISVKFGTGNRYGLIGANGCGKSTFMKILTGDLEPSAGNVTRDPNERIAKLHQDCTTPLPHLRRKEMLVSMFFSRAKKNSPHSLILE